MRNQIEKKLVSERNPDLFITLHFFLLAPLCVLLGDLCVKFYGFNIESKT